MLNSCVVKYNSGHIFECDEVNDVTDVDTSHVTNSTDRLDTNASTISDGISSHESKEDNVSVDLTDENEGQLEDKEDEEDRMSGIEEEDYEHV